MDVDEAANVASLTLLPAKSRKRYEFTYDLFKKWFANKRRDSITENVMLAYMVERTEKLKSPASLWCEYSMLKSTITLNDMVDISKFPKLISYLKRQNKGHCPRKSLTLTRENMAKFFQDASDESYLLMKVVMIIGISGACRTDEMCKMHLSDVTDNGTFVIIKIPDTKNDVPRSFSIVENPEENNYLQVFKKYVEIRKKITNNPRFLLRYQEGKCVNQPVGKHTLAKISSKIAQFLKLREPQLYTGHCFRRTSATLLANTGVDILGLKRHGGWKSSSVAEGYVAECIPNKLDLGHRILFGKTSNTVQGSSSFQTLQPPAMSRIQNAHTNNATVAGDSNLTPEEPSYSHGTGSLHKNSISLNAKETNLLQNEHVALTNASFSNCTVIFNFNRNNN